MKNNNETNRDLAQPKAVSIKKDLYEDAMRKAQSLGLNFSQLICLLIKKEMENNGDCVIPNGRNQTTDKDGISNW